MGIPLFFLNIPYPFRLRKRQIKNLLKSNLSKYGYGDIKDLDFLALKPKNLIQLSQAFFNEWFVEFRLPHSLRETLSDQRIMVKDFGQIPSSWDISELKDACYVIDCLHSPKPNLVQSSNVLLEVYNIAKDGLIDQEKKYTISDFDYKIWTSNIEVNEGDCVITNVGRIAAIGQIPYGKRFAIGRNMTAVRSINGKMTPTYLLNYFLSDYMRVQTYRQIDIGTIMDSLNVKGIKPLKILLPKHEILTCYEEIARPLRLLVELSVADGEISEKIMDH